MGGALAAALQADIHCRSSHGHRSWAQRQTKNTHADQRLWARGTLMTVQNETCNRDAVSASLTLQSHHGTLAVFGRTIRRQGVKCDFWSGIRLD